MKMPKNRDAETLLKNHDSPRENEEPIRRKEGNSEEADENELQNGDRLPIERESRRHPRDQSRRPQRMRRRDERNDEKHHLQRDHQTRKHGP